MTTPATYGFGNCPYNANGVVDVRAYSIFDSTPEGANCPTYAGFFGVMGATSAMIFSGLF